MTPLASLSLPVVVPVIGALVCLLLPPRRAVVWALAVVTVEAGVVALGVAAGSVRGVTALGVAEGLDGVVHGGA